MINYMKLISISCTIYINVMVAETRYRIHLYKYRLIRYHAALWWRKYVLSIFRPVLPK